MDQSPVPDQSSGPPSEAEPPTEPELARVAEDATVRRAPRIGAFIVAGVLVGALVGLVIALLGAGASDDQLFAEQGTAFVSLLEGEGAIRFVAVLAGAGLGALIGAALAVWADRRSLRHR